MVVSGCTAYTVKVLRTTKRKMKTPNIWFWSPIIVFSLPKKEKPISSEQPIVKMAFE